MNDDKIEEVSNTFEAILEEIENRLSRKDVLGKNLVQCTACDFYIPRGLAQYTNGLCKGCYEEVCYKKIEINNEIAEEHEISRRGPLEELDGQENLMVLIDAKYHKAGH